MTSDAVVHPTHYNRADGMPEVWDILDAFHPEDPDLWNAGKYLLRAGHKDSKRTDVRKMVEYGQRWLAKNEGV